MRCFSIGPADLNLPCKDSGLQPALINSCLMGKNCQGDTMQLSFLGGFHEAYRAGGVHCTEIRKPRRPWPRSHTQLVPGQGLEPLFLITGQVKCLILIFIQNKIYISQYVYTVLAGHLVRPRIQGQPWATWENFKVIPISKFPKKKKRMPL